MCVVEQESESLVKKQADHLPQPLTFSVFLDSFFFLKFIFWSEWNKRFLNYRPSGTAEVRDYLPNMEMKWG